MINKKKYITGGPLSRSINTFGGKGLTLNTSYDPLKSFFNAPSSGSLIPQNNTGTNFLDKLGAGLSKISPIVNSVLSFRDNLNNIKNRGRLLSALQDPINTKEVQALNAQANFPDAYQTASGVNARDVSSDFDQSRRDLRASEAANRDAIAATSPSNNQAISQLLRNNTSKGLQQLAASEATAQSQEQARADQYNIGIANQNVATQNQYAKDLAKFENAKAERLTDAKLKDRQRYIQSLDYNNQLNYADKLNRLQYAAQDSRTRRYLADAGLTTLSGLSGLVDSAGVGISTLNNLFNNRR